MIRRGNGQCCSNPRTAAKDVTCFIPSLPIHLGAEIPGATCELSQLRFSATVGVLQHDPIRGATHFPLWDEKQPPTS
jgi:hypothetical protein